MNDILHFIFSSFWIWLGTLVLIVAIGKAVARVIKACGKFTHDSVIAFRE